MSLIDVLQEVPGFRKSRDQRHPIWSILINIVQLNGWQSLTKALRELANPIERIFRHCNESALGFCTTIPSLSQKCAGLHS